MPMGGSGMAVLQLVSKAGGNDQVALNVAKRRRILTDARDAVVPPAEAAAAAKARRTTAYMRVRCQQTWTVRTLCQCSCSVLQSCHDSRRPMMSIAARWPGQAQAMPCLTWLRNHQARLSRMHRRQQ
jgi:hypothetical protein